MSPPAVRLDIERYVLCPECDAAVVVDGDEPFVICPNVHEVRFADADVHERVVKQAEPVPA